MLYSPVQIDDHINTANATLYKLHEKVQEDIIMRGDKSLSNETRVIYLLKKAVEFADQHYYNQLDFQALAAYLKHKISGYGFKGTSAYYAEATTESGSSVVVPGPSGFQLFKQMVVGQPGAPLVGDMIYSNTNLIGRYVDVALDGLILSRGLTDRQSYTYSIAAGDIQFTGQLGEKQVIQIYTYIPSLSGWTKFADFKVTQEYITEYQHNSLIGKSVAVVVDGTLLPIELDDTLSFSYSALIGKILFNGNVPNGSTVIIYTY